MNRSQYVLVSFSSLSGNADNIKSWQGNGSGSNVYGQVSKDLKVILVRHFFSRFSKMQGTVSNGRPVWKQSEGDEFIFYTSTKHWLVGPNYNRTTGCIHSESMFLETIPVTGWRYAVGTLDLWMKDPQLTVKGK